MSLCAHAENLNVSVTQRAFTCAFHTSMSMPKSLSWRERESQRAPVQHTYTRVHLLEGARYFSPSQRTERHILTRTGCLSPNSLNRHRSTHTLTPLVE